MAIERIEDLLAMIVDAIGGERLEPISSGLAAGSLIQKRFLMLRSPFAPRKPSMEERYLNSIDLKGKIVFDIGAHIGIHSLHFSRAVGETGRVVSFEPNPESYRVLVSHLRANSVRNVKALNLGLGSAKAERALLYRSRFRGTGTVEPSIQRDMQRHGRGLGSVRVRLDTLDNCMKTYCLPHPDFVKIDVEGHEYEVLQGMEHICRRSRPSLLIEIHGANPVLKMQNSARLLRLLRTMEYRALHIESKRWLNPVPDPCPSVGHILAMA